MVSASLLSGNQMDLTSKEHTNLVKHVFLPIISHLHLIQLWSDVSGLKPKHKFGECCRNLTGPVWILLLFQTGLTLKLALTRKRIQVSNRSFGRIKALGMLHVQYLNLLLVEYLLHCSRPFIFYSMCRKKLQTVNFIHKSMTLTFMYIRPPPKINLYPIHFQVQNSFWFFFSGIVGVNFSIVISFLWILLP